MSLIEVGALQFALTGVAVSPNGKLIGAGDISGGVTLWDITDKKPDELLKIKNSPPENPGDINAPGSPHSLAFSPDGKLIFSGLHNGTLRSLDANTGTEVQQNQFLNAHVKKMAVSHNGQYLITQQDNNLLTGWDLWSGTALYQLQGEIKRGDPFSQDDSMFAVASAASSPATVNVYNPLNGKEIYIFKSYPDLQTIQFIKTGTQAQLVTVYDKAAIHLWSMASKQELEVSKGYEVTGCLTFYDLNKSPIVSVTTSYYHVVANDLNRPGLCIFETQNWTFSIDEATGLLAYGGGEKLAVVNIHNANREDLKMEGVSLKDVIVRVALSPNGDLIAAAYDDHTLHIWDVAAQDQLTSFSGLYGHNNSITGLLFTPDGKLLISTSLDGTIRLWGVP